MIKNYITVLLTMSLAMPVAAQTLPVRDQIREAREGVKVEIQQKKEEVRKEVSEAKGELRDQVRAKQAEVKTLLEQKRAEVKAQAEQKREEFKQTLETKRAEVKSQVETKKTQLKEQLKKVKDERKQKAVEKINEQLQALNERRMKHFTEVLEKIEKVLVKIISRADKAEDRGLDVSAVRTALDSANAAIATSRSAIEAQSTKVYTITVNTEETLRMDVGKVRQQLEKDIASVRETVKSAHEEAKKAAVTLAQIPKVNEEPVAQTEEQTETSTTQ